MTVGDLPSYHLSLMTLLGIFTWLGYKTSIPIKWSPSVQATINASSHKYS